VNSGSGGLWLKGDTIVKGLEVNANGNLTNNGGTIQLYAPGNVVRIDGKLDVSGLLNGKGVPLGDGGKVFVDAGYLYQSGSILASGKNGGLVQINVGTATLDHGALIEAKGLNGAGGVVNIASPGLVDMHTNTTVNTSGGTVGAFDRNVIDFEGSAVIIEGNLRANGIEASGQGARGGTIRLVASGQSDAQSMYDTLNAATVNNPGDNSAPTISPELRDELMFRNNDTIANFDGGIYLGSVLPGAFTSGLISANGSGDIPNSANDPYGGPNRAGDGGSIIFSANQPILLRGLVQANGANGGNRVNPYAGGNGGTIAMSAEVTYTQPGSIVQANAGAGGSSLSPTGTGAKGGDGGLIALSNGSFFQHLGLIQANGAVGGSGKIPGHGGQGGLVLFGGDVQQDPDISGLITANGAFGGNASAAAGGKPGTIVAGIIIPSLFNPDNFKQLGFINGQLVNNPVTESPQSHELLTHGENLISFISLDYNSISENFFTDTLATSNIRSVTNPIGNLDASRQEVIDKNTSNSPYVYRNLIFSGTGARLDINFQPPSVNGNVTLPTELSRGRGFDTLNTFTVRDIGTISNGGSNQPLNFWIMGREHNIFGGGHISLQSLPSPFSEPFSPQKSNLEINDTLQTNGTANSGSILLRSSDDLNVGTALPTMINASGALHGGAIQLKSAGNMLISGTNQETSINTNGHLMGGSINTIAIGKYTSQLKTTLTADTTLTGIVPAGNPQAGIITLKTLSNPFSETKLTNGQDLGFDGLISSIHANSNNGRGGYVQLGSDGSVVNNIGIIEANGGQHGGVVSLTGKTATTLFPGLPQMMIPSLTPPKTDITGSSGTDFVGQGSVINMGAINALGNGGRIYLGGNEGVVFAEKSHDLYPNSPLPSLNGQAVLPSIIFASSNPNTTLQTIGQNMNKNGQQVYVVAGNALTNTTGQTRSAADIVNSEAAPNHSAPNVNPNQDGQGAAFTQDFDIAPSP